MWLNQQQITAQAIRSYRKTLMQSNPHFVVIDQLFDPIQLQQVSHILQQDQGWQTQQHTYAALYVDERKWQQTPEAQRFVQRDLWQRPALAGNSAPSQDFAVSHNEDQGACAQQHMTTAISAQQFNPNPALEFLQYLRGEEFMALLSRLFRVQITDMHVAQPELNTNYFRLGPADFVNLHADDSPGREICMLLYLNEHWQEHQGGELVFSGKENQPVQIAPLFNRCVLFDPSSEGAEHWVNPVRTAQSTAYRYNVTSWYWTK